MTESGRVSSSRPSALAYELEPAVRVGRGRDEHALANRGDPREGASVDDGLHHRAPASGPRVDQRLDGRPGASTGASLSGSGVSDPQIRAVRDEPALECARDRRGKIIPYRGGAKKDDARFVLSAQIANHLAVRRRLIVAELGVLDEIHPVGAVGSDPAREILRPAPSEEDRPHGGAGSARELGRLPEQLCRGIGELSPLLLGKYPYLVSAGHIV